MLLGKRAVDEREVARRRKPQLEAAGPCELSRWRPKASGEVELVHGELLPELPRLRCTGEAPEASVEIGVRRPDGSRDALPDDRGESTAVGRVIGATPPTTGELRAGSPVPDSSSGTTSGGGGGVSTLAACSPSRGETPAPVPQPGVPPPGPVPSAPSETDVRRLGSGVGRCRPATRPVPLPGAECARSEGRGGTSSPSAAADALPPSTSGGSGLSLPVLVAPGAATSSS